MMYPLAERFSEALFQRYPEFATCAQEDEEGHLVVRVPSPGFPDRFIGVIACDDEVIAGFDAGHSHFHTRWKGPNAPTESEAFQQTLNLLDEIMTEAVYVIVTEKKGRRYRIGLKTAGVPPFLEAGERLLYTRSWLGTYDSEPVQQPS